MKIYDAFAGFQREHMDCATKTFEVIRLGNIDSTTQAVDALLMIAFAAGAQWATDEHRRIDIQVNELVPNVPTEGDNDDRNG